MKSARQLALPLLLAAAVCPPANLRAGAAATGGCARVPVKIELPFETLKGAPLILVHATIAGKPANFILDTGDQLTLLDCEFEGFPGNENHKALQCPGAEFGIAPVKTAEIPSLCFENYCLGKRTVGIAKLGGVSKYMGRRIDGFLGQDVLREFDRVSIDYRKSTVTFLIEGDGQ